MKILDSERQTSYDIYMWNIKKRHKSYLQLICRIETESQILKNLWVPKGSGCGLGGMDWGFGIGICTLKYWPKGTCYIARELYSAFYDNLCGKRTIENGYVYMYDWVSLLYSRNHSLVN